MVSIHGLQLIYCPLEKDFSPNRFSGFQVAYRSAAIQDMESQEIEKRIRSFYPGNLQQIRRQYFILSTGKVVLTNTVSIISDPKIVDRYHRPGTFLVHCLIFDQNEFQKALNNPFLVFDKYSFLNSAEELINQYNQKDGKEPSCSIELNPYSPIAGGQEWWQDAIQIYYLVQQAPTTRKRSLSLSLQGSEYEIDGFLRAAIQFAPSALRLHCTFNTYAEKSPVSPGQYWAVGLLSGDSKGYICVDLAQRGIPSTLPKVSSSDLYLSWLQLASRFLGENIYIQAPSVQELFDAFVKKRYPSPDVSEEACRSFFMANELAVMNNLFVAFRKSSNKAVADKLLRHHIQHQQLLDQKRVLSIAASLTISHQDLAAIIREWMKKDMAAFGLFDRYDWKDIEDLAKKAHDKVLLLWATIFDKNERLRYKTLSEMSEDEYKQSLLLLTLRIDPSRLVSLEHIKAFIQALEPFLIDMDDRQLLDLVDVIISINTGAELGYLTNRVATIDNKRTIRKLQKMIKRGKSISTEFQLAVSKSQSRLESLKKGEKTDHNLPQPK